MSTRARIITPTLDGKFKSVYLHSDGYPEYALAVLQEFYNDKVQANKLVNNGHMSVLGAEIGQAHEFGICENNINISTCEYNISDVCTFYHRDRNDSFEIDYLETLEDAVDGGWDAEHFYFFDGETWQELWAIQQPESVNKW